LWRPYCLEVGTAGHNFERWPPRDYSIKVWFQYAKQFQLKRYISEFPIGSYVKLNLAVAVNLIGRPGNQIPFWKGIIHRPFNQSLAINGLAVSEEKIVLKVFNLLLWNYWINWNQTLQELLLDGPLSELYPTSRSVVQYGYCY
jgi:hypothetical protein